MLAKWLDDKSLKFVVTQFQDFQVPCKTNLWAINWCVFVCALIGVVYFVYIYIIIFPTTTTTKTVYIEMLNDTKTRQQIQETSFTPTATVTAKPSPRSRHFTLFSVTWEDLSFCSFSFSVILMHREPPHTHGYPFHRRSSTCSILLANDAYVLLFIVCEIEHRMKAKKKW